ncbi:ATP-dependent RNA helicase vasa [Anopheles darlingi]|uniref:ATP-dependent RNA helicase vasa n=1 Tax=Anopheles darlingi TaxID=43151 RepID=UPI00210005E8|nr:ATP-dependent RNA helicase vasa [Anopheles darlingi]XP_049548558.1 ATP-dependent RNA helicase vasa [Anopheles darlingi]XP_049548559.1 ATP-dependent RNA helicase vasa [Anopheles darlingi]XP_049548561.1 ATP-dependent RNA helicase vasa [Anopheles darlingi]
MSDGEWEEDETQVGRAFGDDEQFNDSEVTNGNGYSAHNQNGFGGRRGDGGGRGDRDRADRGGGGFRGGRNGDGGYTGNDPSMDEVKTDKPREIYIPPPPTEDENEIFGSGISSGINFENLNEIEVKISGENPPAHIESFAQSGLNEVLLNNVRRSGYNKPTPIQRHAIPIVLKGRDMMGCAQTGSGKTAAFMLPMIDWILGQQDLQLHHRQPYVLVVAPTRELVIQIHDEARKFSHGTGLKVVCIYGGAASTHQLQMLRGGCQIMVATPGRLLDFMDRGVVSFEKVKYVVLDEADRMLDMGFLPAIEKVMGNATMPSKDQRQTLMFSATFAPDIQQLAGVFLNNYIYVAVGIVGGACGDVEQVVYEVEKFKKRKKLEELLGEGNARGTLVFVETKRSADYLASLMSETKFPTTSIHGDRLQREREMALKDFKEGRMDVLIATSVAARGLDIKNVSHVVNYDLPKNIDDYVHRIGRTGRVGNKGRATSFYDPAADYAIAGDLVKILQQANQTVPDFLKHLADGGGGGGAFNGSTFGGRDIRDTDGSRIDAQPAQQEPEELW